MTSTCIMTLANEVNHEKDVLKAIEAILCSIGFNKCNRLVYVTVVISFYYFVCKQSLLLCHMICYSHAFHVVQLKDGFNLVYISTNLYSRHSTRNSRVVSHNDRLYFMTNATFISYSVQDVVIFIICGIISVYLPSELLFDIVHFHTTFKQILNFTKDS